MTHSLEVDLPPRVGGYDDEIWHAHAHTAQINELNSLDVHKALKYRGGVGVSAIKQCIKVMAMNGKTYRGLLDPDYWRALALDVNRTLQSHEGNIRQNLRRVGAPAIKFFGALITMLVHGDKNGGMRAIGDRGNCILAGPREDDKCMNITVSATKLTIKCPMILKDCCPVDLPDGIDVDFVLKYALLVMFIVSTVGDRDAQVVEIDPDRLTCVMYGVDQQRRHPHLDLYYPDRSSSKYTKWGCNLLIYVLGVGVLSLLGVTIAAEYAQPLVLLSPVFIHDFSGHPNMNRYRNLVNAITRGRTSTRDTNDVLFAGHGFGENFAYYQAAAVMAIVVIVIVGFMAIVALLVAPRTTPLLHSERRRRGWVKMLVTASMAISCVILANTAGNLAWWIGVQLTPDVACNIPTCDSTLCYVIYFVVISFAVALMTWRQNILIDHCTTSYHTEIRTRAVIGRCHAAEERSVYKIWSFVLFCCFVISMSVWQYFAWMPHSWSSDDTNYSLFATRMQFFHYLSAVNALTIVLMCMTVYMSCKEIDGVVVRRHKRVHFMLRALLLIVEVAITFYVLLTEMPIEKSQNAKMWAVYAFMAGPFILAVAHFLLRHDGAATVRYILTVVNTIMCAMLVYKNVAAGYETVRSTNATKEEVDLSYVIRSMEKTFAPILNILPTSTNTLLWGLLVVCLLALVRTHHNAVKPPKLHRH
jgi:hypothetical protein